MLKGVYIFVFISCTFLAHAQTNWKTTNADVKFTIKNAGLSVNGKFNEFVGDIAFSPEFLPKSKITTSVASASISTGIEARDKHLKKEDYFNVSAHPLIVMQSKFFAKADDGTYRGYFKLTIKGVTKDIMIPFTFEEKGNRAIMTGTVKLNRLDYQVGGKSLVLSNEVTIHVKLNLEKI